MPCGSGARGVGASGIVGVAVDERSLGRRIVAVLERAAIPARQVPKTAASRADARIDVVITAAGAAASRRVAVVRDARQRWPEARVVVLVADKQGDVRRTVDAGARGILPEDALETALVAAVDAVRAGLLVVPDRTRPVVERAVLSHREKQVLRLVVEGLTSAGIGAELFLAESTVKSHLNSIYGKLGVGSRSEAAQVVLSGDIDLGPRPRTRRPSSERRPAPAGATDRTGLAGTWRW